MEPFFDVTAITMRNKPTDIQMLPNNRWAIDATKPSLA